MGARMTLRRKSDNPKGPQWITLFITHDLQEAHVIVGRLEAHNVPAMIHQEAGANALGITLGNLGEIKILVAPKEYERAKAILYPESEEQIESSNDKIQIIWRDDGDGDEYFVEDDDDE